MKSLSLLAALAKLEEALKNFTWERGSKPGVHAADVRLATEAINTAARCAQRRETH